MGERSQYKMDTQVQQRANFTLNNLSFHNFFFQLAGFFLKEILWSGETDSLQETPFAVIKQTNKQTNKQTKKEKKTLEQQQQTTEQNNNPMGAGCKAFPEQLYFLTFRNTISLKSRLLFGWHVLFQVLLGKSNTWPLYLMSQQSNQHSIRKKKVNLDA